MRIKAILLFAIIATSQINAQTFSGPTGAITNDGQLTHFNLTVSGLATNLGIALGLEEVCMDISHPDMNEITVTLTSPAGISVELINSTSLKGGNFTSTCFNSKAGTSVTQAVAPYSGKFKPTGYLGRFNNNSSGNGTWILTIKDYNPNPNSGTLLSWSLKFGSSAPQPVSFSSSNLPLVIIQTNAQSVSTQSILVDFGVIDNGPNRNNLTDPKNSYNGKARMNIRGSSSQIFEKKAYKIDLCAPDGVTPIDAPLAGMAPESDWVLTPGYSDKTLIRNSLTQAMFRQMGHYSPHTRHVEVFLNDEYQGVYTLIEKPKRNANRIDVAKMTNMHNMYPLVTGGYIWQINRFDNGPNEGWYSLYPGNTPANTKFFYQQEYPRPAEITPEQKNYIKAVMDTFETVMESPNFADPQTGYRKYIDVRSFADFFLINEFSKNVDAYKLSSYMYKDNAANGGKIHMGPVWDYDIAWHNANYGNADSEMWWQYDQQIIDNPIPKWWVKLMTDTYFKDMVWCRWNTMRKTAFQTASVHSLIDQQAAHLAEAQVRNFTQYPILDAYIFPNTPGQIGNSYQAMIDDLKNFVTKRADWLDKNIFGFCADVGIGEMAGNGGQFSIYPNPFTETLSLDFSASETSTATISLVDVMGKVIWTETTQELIGSHSKTIDVSNLAAGTYIFKMELNGQSHYKKIIKTEI